MELHEDGWLYEGRSANRLWEKSALGRKISDGKIILSDAELLFCHKHRGLSLPNIKILNSNDNLSSWITERISNNPYLLMETTILEALRASGNKIVLKNNLDSIGIFDTNSWGLRWNSEQHPSNSDPISEILWFYSGESIFGSEYKKGSMAKLLDLNENLSTMKMLLKWQELVSKNGRIAEILVIDDEQSVVTYRISEGFPQGDMRPPTDLDFEKISSISLKSEIQGGGLFFSQNDSWPNECIGIPSYNGRKLDLIESEIYKNKINKNKNKETDLTDSAKILIDLWNRGLNTRSGFKYGTAWRCYIGEIGNAHAPWLVVDSSKEGPENWAEVCLSSRLASGVNKKWLYPILDNGSWRYLEVSRPPSDSRWTNPNKV